MQIILPQLPEIGKTYISNIPSAPHIVVRIKVDAMREIMADAEWGIDAGFIATCSFPDEPDAPCLDLVPEDWVASGFSLEVH